ncbi:hypothetical protein [Methylobacterium sp. C1]|uniref:hypothetical protein n=1 Tax=Methylobacterium sp. C1 TaxID=1479019 RepID=UPI00133124A7|nr:hypothetical protein [Methylobacterium sp. C1]
MDTCGPEIPQGHVEAPEAQPRRQRRDLVRVPSEPPEDRHAEAGRCGSGDAHAVLRVPQERPAIREARALRRCATRRLASAFFNEDEANRVIADIIVRAEHGRREWVDSRKFRVWRDGGRKAPRPERKGDLKGKVDAPATGWHDALDEHNATSAGLGAPQAVIG